MLEIDNIKKLVFHFYVPSNWEDSNIIKIHLYLLKYFSQVFTEMTIVVSVDDVNDNELISNFKHKLLEHCLCNDITIKVTTNSYLNESKTLHDEVMEKLGETDGLVFFAHSKGVGNEMCKNSDMRNISKWVAAMYYFNLTRIWEVNSKLFDIKGVMYGTFKTKSENMFKNRYNWIYSGTFYWINAKKLKHCIETRDDKPRECYDRFYSELWPGDVFSFEDFDYLANEAASFNGSYIVGDCVNYYNDIDEYLKLSIYEEALVEFNNFFENMLQECEIKFQQ